MSGRTGKEGREFAARLYPQPYLEVEEIYEDLTFPTSDSELPYVVINMVSSVDGKVSAGGKSGAIGSEVDRSTMRVLRSRADAVMVGAGTLRAERVSLSSEGRRVPEPKAIISTNSLDLPLENLVVSEDQETFFMIPEGSERGRVEALGEKVGIIECVREVGGGVDLRSALVKLRSEYKIDSLLLEGGPGLNQSFASLGLVDEIFLTFSPKLLGGGENSTGILSGSQDPTEKNLDLLSIHQDTEGELFLRYRL